MFSLLVAVAYTAIAQTDTSTRTYTLSSSVAVEYQENVEIEGNQVLPDQVYRVLLDGTGSWPKGQRLARMKTRVLRFLRAAGYELARAELRQEADRLVLDVDEGRLERIIFPGQSGLGALRLQLELDLPGEVFNRPQLEEQLHRFQTEHGIKVLEYKLVPVGEELHAGLQLADLGEIRGTPIVPKVGRFELQIFVEERELPTGVHLEADVRGADGLRTRLKYRAGPLLADDERWEVGAEIGMRIQDLLRDSEGQRFFSRGAFGLRWYSPRLADQPLRFIVQPEATWLSRQRRDLGIMRYDNLLVQPTAYFSLRVKNFLNLSLGGGVEWNRLTNVDGPTGDSTIIEPPRAVLPVVLAQVELELGRNSVRLDRLHEIKLESRTRLGKGDVTQHRLALAYDTTFGFGFDDLRLTASGMTILGDVAFTEEARLADRVRGLFGDEIFCSKTAGVGAEYRISLAREMYKIGIFHDGAVCAPETIEGTVWANAFGVGFHTLLLDTFRVSINLAQGFASGNRSDQGLSIGLSQVF